MNKKAVEDLIKNNPDLDKKKLEEVILLLKQNNPDIKIDKKFKQNLKSRLDAIIDFKEETKKGFFGRLFLVPVFSVFLIAGGVFYIYGDINLLDNNDLQYKNSEILDEIQYIEEIEEEKINLKNKNSPIIPLDKEDEDKKIERDIKIKKQKIQTKEDNTQIEDNKIIEILGDDISTLEPFDLKSISPETPDEGVETMFYGDGMNEPYINTFDEYCEEYNSEILGDDKKRFCIIEEKICMESDYSENTCKLIEKK